MYTLLRLNTHCLASIELCANGFRLKCAAYIHTHTHTYTHTYIHSYTHTYIHTHIHTYIYTYIHIRIDIYIYIYIIYIYIYIWFSPQVRRIKRQHPCTLLYIQSKYTRTQILKSEHTWTLQSKHNWAKTLSECVPTEQIQQGQIKKLFQNACLEESDAREIRNGPHHVHCPQECRTEPQPQRRLTAVEVKPRAAGPGGGVEKKDEGRWVENFLCVCVCVCVCVCMIVCVIVCMYVHVYTHKHMYII